VPSMPSAVATPVTSSTVSHTIAVAPPTMRLPIAD